eukprot:380369-Amphidinium_carterae.1
MESATDALESRLRLVRGGKKARSCTLYFKLVDKAALGIVKQIGNQDGFEAYRRLAVRYAPRTSGRNLT